MSPHIRAVLAVIAGVFVGGILISVIQAMSPYHPPMDVTPENAAAFTDWVRSLPTDAYLIVLASYLCGAFVAGAIADYIALPTGFQPAMVAGFILLIFGIANFLAYPHPVWLTYASCIGFVVFAGIGGWLVRRWARRAKA